MLTEILRTGQVTVSAVCDVNFAIVKKYAEANGVEGFKYYTDANLML